MDITRETLDGIGPNGVDVRLYTRDDDELPSVTSILKTRSEDKSNLYDWQDRNDGNGDTADHDHLFWYSRQLGTLGHWHALHDLDDSLEWSSDEARSLWAIANVQNITDDSIYRFYDERLGHDVTLDGSKHKGIHDVGPREVLYSILRGDRDKAGGTVASWGEFYDKYPPYRSHEFYADALVDRTETNIEFFRDAQNRLWDKLGITESNIITVEEFLFNDEHNYAGQVDLVYEDENGFVVVADLKSSSGCYDKHQIQGAAYGKAIELSGIVDSVDRLEVHRAHPRTGQMAVHTHKGAPGEQPIHTTKYWRDGFGDLWDEFRQLSEKFSYVNPDEVDIAV